MPAPTALNPPATLRPLAGELLLAAWEAAATAPELRRPLALLAAAMPGTDQAALGARPIAEVNLLLLRLRELTFGPELAVFGRCPECGQQLEFTLPAGPRAAQQAAATAGPVEWTEDGCRYRLRPVTTDDLAAALAVADPAAAEDRLLARCLEIRPDQPGAPPVNSPPVNSPAVRKRFEELHADAEIRCAVSCPGCSGQHLLDLDIARFLWREVATAASRLLTEVHLLATAYGWPERDIMRLPARRRAAYLQLVAG